MKKKTKLLTIIELQLSQMLATVLEDEESEMENNNCKDNKCNGSQMNTTQETAN